MISVATRFVNLIFPDLCEFTRRGPGTRRGPALRVAPAPSVGLTSGRRTGVSPLAADAQCSMEGGKGRVVGRLIGAVLRSKSRVDKIPTRYLVLDACGS